VYTLQLTDAELQAVHQAIADEQAVAALQSLFAPLAKVYHTKLTELQAAQSRALASKAAAETLAAIKIDALMQSARARLPGASAPAGTVTHPVTGQPTAPTTHPVTHEPAVIHPGTGVLIHPATGQPLRPTTTVDVAPPAAHAEAPKAPAPRPAEPAAHAEAPKPAPAPEPAKPATPPAAEAPKPAPAAPAPAPAAPAPLKDQAGNAFTLGTVPTPSGDFQCTVTGADGHAKLDGLFEKLQDAGGSVYGTTKGGLVYLYSEGAWRHVGAVGQPATPPPAAAAPAAPAAPPTAQPAAGAAAPKA